MNYLDVSPMMHSLRTMPEDFDMKGRWLRHNPSRHCFRFERDGSVTIRAGCNCAFLMIHPEQRHDLEAAYQVWRQSYWEPLEINREFASHFASRSPIRRFLIRLAARLHGWLSQQNDTLYPMESRTLAK
jgi:hypothetical protein